MAIPHTDLGDEPFAVLGSYNRKTEEEIKTHVLDVFGVDYALGGLASLEQLCLHDFPINPTHKVVKSELQMSVMEYVKRVKE